jgi:hypothetical protein
MEAATYPDVLCSARDRQAIHCIWV